MLSKLFQSSVATPSESRNGDAFDIGPAYLELSAKDTFRLPVLSQRRLNPFFALAEFSWLITGSNRLDTLQYFIKDYAKYSDDQLTLNGAYGHRLRESFNRDQILIAIEELRKSHSTRRIVLSMWSVEDLGKDSKDLPCNIALLFKIREGNLDITVINRSNDLFLGIPYNVVVFYLLQCYVAKAVGVPVGVQRHYIDSLHLYEKDRDQVGVILEHNSKSSLEGIYSDKASFELSTYLSADHVAVVNLDFSRMDDSWGRFFNFFSGYRKSKNKQAAVEGLSDDLLGYAGKLYFGCI